MLQHLEDLHEMKSNDAKFLYGLLMYFYMTYGDNNSVESVEILVKIARQINNLQIKGEWVDITGPL
jgi:hypothetical protein